MKIKKEQTFLCKSVASFSSGHCDVNRNSGLWIRLRKRHLRNICMDYCRCMLQVLKTEDKLQLLLQKVQHVFRVSLVFSAEKLLKHRLSLHEQLLWNYITNFRRKRAMICVFLWLTKLALILKCTYSYIDLFL